MRAFPAAIDPDRGPVTAAPLQAAEYVLPDGQCEPFLRRLTRIAAR